MISLSSVLAENLEVAKFFKYRHVPKAILLQHGGLNVKLACPTRWSSYYEMLQRNLRIKNALRLAIIDSNCDAPIHLQMRTLNEDDFWVPTETVAALLKPASHAISAAEGDFISISIAPDVFSYMEASMIQTLRQSFLSDEEKKCVQSFIENRRKFCISGQHYAANLLDPRFRGRTLTEQQLVLAEDTIFEIAQKTKLSTTSVSKDLLEYRTRSGALFNSSRMIWKVGYDTDPIKWWQCYGNTRQLNVVAVVLLSMSATTAAVERANKEFSLQKTKLRNSLTDERASILTSLAYNHKIKST